MNPVTLVEHRMTDLEPVRQRAGRQAKVELAGFAGNQECKAQSQARDELRHAADCVIVFAGIEVLA